MFTRDTIGNFIGGVSQQPDKLMFPNQAKELVNMIPNPAIGLTKRHPTEHIARLLADPLSKHPKCHTIVKENENYEVILTGSDIKVFDLNGVAKTVNYGNLIYEVIHNSTKCYTDVAGASGASVVADTVLYTDYQLTTQYTLASGEAVTDFAYNGVNQPQEQTAALQTYITTNTPLKDLDATTIGDYTFILNKTIPIEMESETYPNPHPASAIIFVKQGDYAIDYTIKVNGTQVASKTTSKDNIEDCKTNTIATALYNNLTSNLSGSDWEITQQNSTILLRRKDGSSFTIQTSDSNADRNLYSFYKETDDFTNLPVVAPDGFIIKVIGEDASIDDDYYVQFKTADGSSFGTGSWQECPSPDCTYKLKASTMPHALVREANGTFTFKTIDWTNRRAGDEDSAKTPSFVGETIQEVFTHKGRIAFLAADKSIYSDTEDVFAFFKKTVLTSLDTDPIDVNSNSKMVLLKHSLPFNEDLILFSPTSEFTMQGGDIFSNSTVTLDLTMEYPCSPYCKPIGAGDTGLFVFENGNYSGVYEIYVTSQYTKGARCITEQIPCYIPKNVYKMVGSVKNNMVVLLSTEEKDTMYLYNYYYSSEQKAQSAWSKWKFEDTEILNVDFIDHYMYITTQYTDGVYLERINCTPKVTESTLDFLVHLDRKVILTGTYDSEEDVTNFTIPYTPVNDISVVDKNGFLIDFELSGTTLTLEGHITDSIYVGNTYYSLWRMSNIYQRKTNNNGSTSVVEGLLILRDLNLTYTDSGYFRATVTPHYNATNETTFDFGVVGVKTVVEGDTSNYDFTGVVLGTASAQLGKVTPYSDKYLIPVMCKNEDVDITVINDSYLPSNFLSLEWIGDMSLRGQG